MSLSNMYQLENLVLGLLEALNDKNPDVHSSVIDSLSTLGTKKAEFILKQALSFMQNAKVKLNESHKSLIFNAMEKIVKENLNFIGVGLAQEWIVIASNEMTQKDNTTVYLQESSSHLLVAIGERFINEVFQQLQKFFTPGKLPHLYVINTMADLAEINPFGVVPNLTDVLASMLPMIGMAKLDSYKVSFGSAMCKFSEAILFYCDNKEKANDQSVEKSLFATQIYATHEIFFNVWIRASDFKVRHLAIESIGQFVNIIAHDKLEADLVKIMQTTLGLYKKHQDHFIVSQTLYMIIKAAVRANQRIVALDTIVDIVIKEMYGQVVNSLDQLSSKNANATTMVAINKNQNELLRCFAELANQYSDKLVPFMIQKFEQNNEKNRIASLTVLKHLINSCKEEMENKKQLIVSGLRLLVNENNNKVKRSMIQIIVAMSYHGYLNLEGGQLLIEFLLKQCSLDTRPPPADKKAPIQECTDLELRSTAESILTLFSTTVENMHEVLWPSLFEYLENPNHSHCMNHLCKNLAHIADVKRTNGVDDYYINFDVNVNLPKPLSIFARLIVLCGCPLQNKNQGLSILHLMKNISPNLNSAIVEVWDNVLPKLITNLEDKIAKAKFNEKTWQDLVMKLLSNSLDQINEEEYICEIARALGNHIETLYSNSSQEKHFAYKCLGLVLNKTTSKNTIDKHLDLMFNNVNHTDQVEREGCAISFGYCASIHLDTVLLKLETYAKNDTKKSFFGSFGGSGSKGDPELTKATIVLSYGYVTFYAAKDLIISRLETYILRNVGGYAAGPIKDIIFKQNILKSIDLITKCMHQDHLQKDFNFSYKATLLNQIITYVSADGNKVLLNDTKAMCFKILANIVKLNPKLTEADMYLIIKTATDGFYSLQLPVSESDLKKENSKNKSIMSSDSSSMLGDSQVKVDVDPIVDPLAVHTTDLAVLHADDCYELTAKALDNLLQTCLDREMTSESLSFIFKYLEPWIGSINDPERLRVMRTLSRVLKHFAENYKATDENDKGSFEFFGYILGSIIGRLTDSQIVVRIISIDCIESLLKLYQLFTDTVIFDQSAKLFEQLLVFKQKLTKPDNNVMLSVVNDLAKFLCKLIPSGRQLMEFIKKLIEGLLDVQDNSSSATCIFLNFCVKLRAAELKDDVESIITQCYHKLSLIQNPQAKLGTLRTIRVLFQNHLVTSLNVILSFPIPCNKDMIDICQSLCEDSKLIDGIIEHLLQVWNRCLPYEEKNGTKYASLTPLIGTCILSEIFSNNGTEATETVFKESFAKIFSALFMRVSSTLANVMPYPKGKEEWVDPKATTKNNKQDKKNSVQQEYKKLNPSKLTVDCLKNFIKCTQSYDLFEFYNAEDVWSLLGDETRNAEGCFILAKGFCLHAPEHIPEIVNNLNLFLSAPYDCHKISVTAFLSELINHECILDIVEKLMNSLLSKLIDQNILVRTLCIRGLGNIASLGKAQVQLYSTTILSAMMAGLDDKDDINDDITLESMNGLNKIIALIDENNVRPILINILLRIRPCFEKDKGTIRTSAYTLFGKLARFGEGPSKDPYMEQIHSNFVSFILHLDEVDASVRKSCKTVLKQVGPLIQSTAVNELFQSCLLEEKQLHYGEFINDLSKVLVTEFPEKISFYIMNSVSNFKSQWTEIRCNAVLFAGYMLGHLNREAQSVLSKEHITNALIKLLKEDPSPLVRQKAAEAISLLSEF